MSKISKLKFNKDKWNGAAHWQEKTNAQRQNHPFSWHRSTIEKLEVGNIYAPVSQSNLSLAATYSPWP